MSEKKNICQSCKKNFKTISILNQHLASSKSCAKIRGEKPKTYDCSFCNKPFTTNAYRKKHVKTCEFLHTYVSDTLIGQIAEMRAEINTCRDEITRCHKEIAELKSLKDTPKEMSKKSEKVDDPCLIEKLRIEPFEKENSRTR